MAAKKRISTRVINYKNTFATPDGQKVLVDLMKTHFVMSSTMSQSNVEQVIFREGERNVVLRILSIINVSPEQLKEIMKEEKDE